MEVGRENKVDLSMHTNKFRLFTKMITFVRLKKGCIKSDTTYCIKRIILLRNIYN